MPVKEHQGVQGLLGIRFLGPNGKVLEPDHLRHLIQEFDLGIGDENGLLCHRCVTGVTRVTFDVIAFLICTSFGRNREMSVNF